MSTTTNDDLRRKAIEKLRDLASHERQCAEGWVDRMDEMTRTVFLTEVCRLMNVINVKQIMSASTEGRLASNHFDTLVKGWNALLALLLSHTHRQRGLPIVETTLERRGMAYSALYRLGMAAVAEDASEMLRFGILRCYETEGRLHLKVDEDRESDHFLDRTEWGRLESVNGDLDESIDKDVAPYFSTDWRRAAKNLVFPFSFGETTMIGYDMTPEMDDHFIAAVLKATLKWRDGAGIHPNSRFGRLSGGDIFNAVNAIASFHLKHIQFVDAGMEVVPGADFLSSLTIWISRSDLLDNVMAATRLDEASASEVVDLVTAKAGDSEHFASAATPYFPFYVQVTDDLLICNVSAIFRNPLHGIRAVLERKPGGADSVRGPREDWMQAELYDLFQGNRYQCVSGQIKLKSGSVTATDIDAAIMDNISGDVALFQLKWQDFDTHDIKSQFSKAKNFSDQTKKWATRISAILTDLPVNEVYRKCRFKPPSVTTGRVFMFALGRIAARFKSYGFAPDNDMITPCSFPQLRRLRQEIGKTPQVFSKLRNAIMAENEITYERKPIPHDLHFADDAHIVLDDLWSD